LKDDEARRTVLSLDELIRMAETGLYLQGESLDSLVTQRNQESQVVEEFLVGLLQEG
jgi:hypothetical protein